MKLKEFKDIPEVELSDYFDKYQDKIKFIWICDARYIMNELIPICFTLIIDVE